VNNEKRFVLKGDICWSKSPDTLTTIKNGYLVCIDGKAEGAFHQLPELYNSFPVIDYSPCLIIPGLVDLHIHAPQFAFRGLGMDLELLDWLDTHAFVEEAKYSDTEYARNAYSIFVEHLKQGPNTRMAVYATVHTESTCILMDLMEKSGLVSLVGKVNMDRNCPPNLSEKNASSSLAATEKWLAYCNYSNTKPILTPRFIPSCSDELMNGIAALQKKYKLPVQSHISENRKEIELVKELRPKSSSYGAAYKDNDLFGNDENNNVLTLMAHCTWSDEDEISLMAQRQVYAVHCPQSNINLSSGIAPVRRFLDAGMCVGLGSDVAGGVHSSIFRAMTDAIQVSKIRKALLYEKEKPLSLEEAFYLATVSGGSFFEKTGLGASGSFEKGNDFDTLVIDDKNLSAPFELSIRDRLERIVYLSDDRNIKAKYVKGLLVNCATNV
jgi:guanine deaminase